MGLRCLLALLVMMCFGLTPALAAPTGGLKGVVVDDAGLQIPGVLLTLASPALIGGAQQRTSDDVGAFRFDELPPGAYALTAQKQGFGPVRLAEAKVLVGRVTPLSVTMRYGGAELVIEADRTPIDTERVTIGSAWDARAIGEVPVDRSVMPLIGATSGVIGVGGLYVQGGVPSDNTWRLDGVNITDPVSSTFTATYHFDAIAEIEVLTGGFDPEYGGSLGAQINVVTKSGGNRMESAAQVRYRDGGWTPRQDARYTADGALLSPADATEQARSGDLAVMSSGPVVRDRVWFLGSYTWAREVATQEGMPLPADTEAHSGLFKLTAQPGDHHRLTLGFTTEVLTVDNANQVSANTAAEAQYQTVHVSRNGYLRWNWFVNPTTWVEATAAYGTWDDVARQEPCTHDQTLGYNPCSADEADHHVDYDTPGRIGYNGAPSTDNVPYAEEEDKRQFEGALRFTQTNLHLLGSHEVKVGADLVHQRWHWLWLAPGNVWYADYYVDANDPNTYTSYYSVETSGLFDYDATGDFADLFLQDVWKPRPELTIRGGLRYDYAWVKTIDGAEVFNDGLLQPRIYAAWDPWADRKTRVYGGYGRVVDQSNIGIVNYLAKNSFGYKYYGGELLGGALSTASDSYGDYGTAGTTIAAADLAPPHVDQLVVGMEREVVTDVVANAEGVGKFARNIYTFDDTNLIIDEDGYSIVGSYDGTTDSVNRLRTPSSGRRDYLHVSVGLAKVDAHRWMAGLQYTYAVSRGSFLFNGGDSTRLNNPADVKYMYGNLATDLRHQVKGHFSWALPDDPWTTRVGARLVAFSGPPLTRTWPSASGTFGTGAYDRYVEPVGEYARGAPYVDLSVELRQKIPVRHGALWASVEVDNALGLRFWQAYDGAALAAEGRLLATDLQDPRSITLGLRWED